MAFTTLNLGLTLTIPTNGTRNWGSVLFNTTWTNISDHDHTGSGKGKKIGTTALENLSITSALLAANLAFKGNTSFQQFGTTLTPVGTTQTITFTDGNIQKLNVGSASGDVTVTLSAPVIGSYYKIFIIQGATARDVIWPAAVLWPQAQKPILSTVSGDVDIINLYYDGTNYFGDWNLKYS